MRLKEGNTGVEKERELIATILKENITFSGQVGDYVIHGAIEKIMELIEKRNAALKELIPIAERVYLEFLGKSQDEEYIQKTRDLYEEKSNEIKSAIERAKLLRDGK